MKYGFLGFLLNFERAELIAISEYFCADRWEMEKRQRTDEPAKLWNIFTVKSSRFI